MREDGRTVVSLLFSDHFTATTFIINNIVDII